MFGNNGLGKRLIRSFPYCDTPCVVSTTPPAFITFDTSGVGHGPEKMYIDTDHVDVVSGNPVSFTWTCTNAIKIHVFNVKVIVQTSNPNKNNDRCT